MHIDDSPWVRELDELPDDHWVPAGTAGEVRPIAYRPDTPVGATFHHKRIYGTAGEGGRELQLYCYSRSDPSQTAPGVVFIHGGGWRNGDPYFHIRHANHLAARGFVTATIHYRLIAEATWPAALEDCKCAVRWMRANADELGVDPDRIAVAGGSAGGHLAAMVALTPGRFEGAGGHSDVGSDVQAAVLWYPIVDLSPDTAMSAAPGLQWAVDEFVGDPARYAEASPVTHLHAGAPPLLIMTGSADVHVPVHSLERFRDAAVSQGVACRLEITEGAEHGFDLRVQNWQTSFELMADFLDEAAPVEG